MRVGVGEAEPRLAAGGQAPQVVEDQVTYPLTTAMLSVPGAVTVRGYSFFGDSYVYVLFEDGTDLYWARSRVLEYLSQVQDRLPATASTALGPDATGVGWVFEYALVDRSGQNDISQLRSLQDWFLKFELQAVPGVAKAELIGNKTFAMRIWLDPKRMAALNVTANDVRDVLRANNYLAGVSQSKGIYTAINLTATTDLASVEDFRKLVVRSADGILVRLDDIATPELGAEDYDSTS